MGVFAKNIMIGVFVLVAIALIIFILLFLHPSVGDDAKTLKVRFTNIDKITVGTRVTFAGKPVGEVVEIRELPDARTTRVARNGDVYVYELVLKVDSGVSVYNTDTVTVFTSGLLGEKGVEINPEPLKGNEELISIENQIIYATPARSLDETMQQIEQVTHKIANVLDNMDKTIDEFREEKILKELSSLVKETKDTVHGVHNIVDTLNKPEKWETIFDQLDHSIVNFKDLTQRAHETWTTVDQAVNNTNAFTEKANDLVNYVMEGNGTIGRLLVHDDFYLRVKAVISKAETIMKDINNYGILYQNNKRWQREYAWRKNLLSKLSTPDAFSQYFNQEMQAVNHSISQVSMVLNEVQQYPENLINNDCYGRRYAELLQQVEELQDSLKMYNQQIIDLNTSEECSYR